MIGVYKITNTVDGKVYIGSTTIDTNWRWSTHKSLLKIGKHHNRHLQRAWNKYGESAFTFEVVEQGVTKEEIRSKERSWIQKFFGVNCYNATTEAAGRPANPNKKHQRTMAEWRQEQDDRRQKLVETNRMLREQKRIKAANHPPYKKQQQRRTKEEFYALLAEVKEQLGL
jgi:group I intron endonuclease